MPPSRVTKGQALVGALTIGLNMSAIKGVKYGTVTIDPASINATTQATTAVTITGVAAGDIVILTPPTTLEAGLTVKGFPVTGANTVSLILYNTTGGAVDGASRVWEYLWFDLT